MLPILLEGRGFLGFAAMTATDSATGHKTTTNYSQVHPYIGQVTATEQRQSNNTLISSVANFFQAHTISGVIKFPYVSFSTVNNHEVDGTNYSRVQTQYTYDTWGNNTQTVVTTTDLTPGAVESYTTTTNNKYVDNTSNWHLGRLVCTKVTQTHPNSGVPTKTRVSGFDYHNTTGLLTKEVIEPRAGDIPDDSTCVTTAGSAEKVTLRTTYTHDTYGNREMVIVSGEGVTSRTTTTVWGERSTGGTVTTNGRFAVTVTNALSHVEKRTYDGKYGVMTKLTGPNNLDTTWAYDTFGRVTLETRADGTTTTTTRGHCASDCPVGAKLALLTQTTGQPGVRVYTDSLGREIYTETVGFSGDAVFVGTTYDTVGRVKTKTRPYYYNETPVVSTIGYDAHSRPVTETQPGPTGSNVTTTTIYDGLTTTIQNPLGQQTTRIVNARGELVTVLQGVASSDTNTQASTTYLHDAFGNLLKTTDDQNNQIINTYNIRGHKLTMDDPDMGDWTYVTNALGELTSQTDAKGQTTTMAYDKLGRQLTRTDDVGGSNQELAEWIYDTAPTKGKGKLYQVKRGGAVERTLTYDSVGRLSGETHVVDTTSYGMTTAYDTSGRVASVIYPASPHHPSGFKAKYVYNTYGYLEKVTDNGATTTYWQATGRAADGQLTHFLLGNGLKTQRLYNQYTRLIQNIDTGTTIDPTSVQELEYGFDALGNLTSRADHNQQVNPGGGTVALTEVFGYDDLNRVTSSQVNTLTSKSYAYDTLGNITSKAGVGSYSYSGINAGPHAVTSAGSHTYTYDANGNQRKKQSGSTVVRDITYTSFNKPKRIDKGGTWVEFTYGADRGRIKQIDDTGRTLVYVAGAGARYEKETLTNGTTRHLHYIAAGGAVVSIYQSQGQVSGGNETAVAEKETYLHRDHLGSIAAITSDSGAVLEQLSYDVWGKRRNATGWTDATTQLTSNETHRGFTGHEMLDAVGLVHMNGRVYDPDLGRFISADPFIQFADNPQSFNRYTYVLNNPLSFTDPSGFGLFSFVKKIFKSVAKAFTAVFKAVKSVVRAVASQIKTIAAIGATVVGAAYGCPACGGFVAGLIAGDGDIRAGIIGAATAYAFGQLHFNPANFGEKVFKVVAHGVVGGLSQELQGGRFVSGFLAAGATQAFSLSGGFNRLGVSNSPEGFGGYAQNAAAAAVVGGTASVIGGGKFQNGAITGAFSRLFNDFKPWEKPTVQHQTSESVDLPNEFKSGLRLLLGNSIDTVAIYEESGRVALFNSFGKITGTSTIATTLRDTIYLKGNISELVVNTALILEEYYHVVEQWNNGLTQRAYLSESTKQFLSGNDPYFDNKFEVEAKGFASQNKAFFDATIRR